MGTTETEVAALVQATQNFAATIGGGPPRIIRKGMTYPADHPVVQANPTRFGGVRVQGGPPLHAAPPPPVEPPPPPTREERIAALEANTRPQLNELAAAAGIEDAEALPNKAAVATAIVDKLDEPAQGDDAQDGADGAAEGDAGTDAGAATDGEADAPAPQEAQPA